MPPIDSRLYVSNSGGTRGIVNTQPVHVGPVTTGRGPPHGMPSAASCAARFESQEDEPRGTTVARHVGREQSDMTRSRPVPLPCSP
jgi:hypothetical protein